PTIDEKLQQLVMGIQGQIWTEYMPTPAHVEYMLLPRMLALAESAWTLPAHKNWTRFSNSVISEFDKYDAANINYSKSVFRPCIDAKLDTASRRLRVSITTDIPTEIRYTLDGSAPTLNNSILYTQPFFIDRNTTISAVAVQESKVVTATEKADLFVHKALGREVTFKHQPYHSYTAKGGRTLVDMEYGGRTWGSGKWIGVLDKDLDITIDLEEATTVHKVILSCINDRAAGIYFPKDIEVFVSQDGKSFKPVHRWKNQLSANLENSPSNTRRHFALDIKPSTGKFIRIKAGCLQLKNKGVFIFADEVIIQ
ncbi:MAG: FN3 associated domain-containing protein, partial [Bacteroidota bacterium]